MTQRIGLFGGTFDPVHQGHINACQQIHNELSLDKLFMIPAFQPVHKQTPEVSTEQRLAMLALACDEQNNIEWDDREIQRGGPSYTLLTLQEYRSEHQDCHLYFILGMDAFEQFDTWYHWEEFLDYCNLLIVDRPGTEVILNPQIQAFLRINEFKDIDAFKASKAGGIYHSRRVMLQYSSTEVRQNIHNSEKISGMLPEKVLNYIREHKLYR